MNGQHQSNAEQRMRNFFDNEISTFILPDIDRLTNEIRPNERGLRGCAVPLAMMLFSLMDLFGFLMRPEQNANKRNTRKNFEYLLSASGYFSEVYARNLELIIVLFRHGIMHQFFPKASGIAKAGFDTPLIFTHEKKPILNVDALSVDLVEAINQIRADIFSRNSSNLILRMNNRLDELAQDDYNELAEFDESE